MKPCIPNLLLEYIFSLFFTREFIVVCAREGGANTTSFLAAHFAKRRTKNCGGEKRSGESEGGQKFLPPNPLPFYPPERKSFNQNSASGFSSKKVRILTKRHRQFSKFGFWAIIASPRLWRGETENSSCINWRKGWDSNPRGYHYPTAFREPRFQPNSATLP